MTVQAFTRNLSSQDVEIKWMPLKMNGLPLTQQVRALICLPTGQRLTVALILNPDRLSGTGIINMSDSRINSNLFTFASNAIRADTADYNLKSPSTSGYAFIAENANTDINFGSRLNKVPSEYRFICCEIP